MPSIRLNNKKIDMAEGVEAQDSTVASVIQFVADTHIPANYVITSLAIDGAYVTEETEEDYLSRTYSDLDNIEIEIESQVEVAQEALDTAIDHAEAIIPVVKFAATDYRNQQFESAEHHFRMAIDALDLFVKLINNISNTLKISSDVKIDEEGTLQMLESHLLSTMQNILKAKEKEDIVALAELLDQDLAENLERWATKGLLKMRDLKTS